MIPYMWNCILLFVSPRSPSSMLNLCHAKLPKVVSDLFTTLNCGKGGDEICFVNAQYNFAVLVVIVSRVMSKIVAIKFNNLAINNL